MRIQRVTITDEQLYNCTTAAVLDRGRKFNGLPVDGIDYALTPAAKAQLVANGYIANDDVTLVDASVDK